MRTLLACIARLTGAHYLARMARRHLTKRDQDHLEALKSSYLYLRLSLIGVVAAIFLALLFTPAGYKPEDEGILRSISHYYYTPARIVFTAALCAAAVALLALAGKGVQSYLLDLAALLAPLVAIVPTRTLRSEVGSDAELGSCVTGWPTGVDCIPEDQLDYVAVGFWIWFWFAIAGMLVALVRGTYRSLKKKPEPESPWYWIILVAAVAFVIIYTVWYASDGSADLQMWGHITAAGTFFILIMIVAVIEGFRQLFAKNMRTPAYLPRRAYAVIYGVLAALLAGDIIAAVVVLARGRNSDIGNAVFVVEVIGLVAFAAFWLTQTVEHLHDADGWLSPKDPHIRNSSAQASVQQDLAIAGYYSGEIDGLVGPQTRDAIMMVQNKRNLAATGSIDKKTAKAIRAEIAV